jgi:hypothetical protein
MHPTVGLEIAWGETESHLAKCNDDHFPYRLPQQCFGNDSDVPRIFILNFTSTSGPHAQDAPQKIPLLCGLHISDAVHTIPIWE